MNTLSLYAFRLGAVLAGIFFGLALNQLILSHFAAFLVFVTLGAGAWYIALLLLQSYEKWVDYLKEKR